MKLLLDENLPKKLKRDFPEHTIYTVSDKGWNSKKNGELLALMILNDFDVLITFDQNLAHQQNFDTYPILVPVLIASKNTYEVLSSLIPYIKVELEKPLRRGSIRISEEG